MNISFDLDSTLIPNGNEFESERIRKTARLFGVEKIRKETKELIYDLQKQGHSINIYTTSFRAKSKIRITFFYYGIKINKIVTQKENIKKLKSLNIYASKYPKAFNFDLHIDDSKGVEIESNKYKFKTIIINPNDINWVKNIKDIINNLNN